MPCTQSNWKKRIIICLCASFMFMFICHGFLLFNPSYSHDSLSEIVRDKGHFQTSLGRFLQPGWKMFFSEVTSTWFIGCLTAVFIGISAAMLGDLFQIRRNESLVFMSGILITNHCMITAVASYMPWIDTHGAALMLAVSGVWLLYKYRFGFLLAIIPLIAVLGLYPPYLVCVLAIVVIQMILSLQQKGVWKKRLIYILKAAVMLVIAYVLYAVILNIILKYNNITYSDGNNSMANIKLLGFNNLKTLLTNAFSLFFSELTITVCYMQFSSIIIGLIGFSYMVILVIFAVKTRFGVWESIALVLLLLAIPFVFNIQYIVCEDATYHSLMVYSIYFAYILLIPLYDSISVINQNEARLVKEESFKNHRSLKKSRLSWKWIEDKARCCVPFVLVIVLFADIRFANNVYTDKYLRERTTLSVMTRIMTTAEQTEGFDPAKSRVLIVGDLRRNPIIAAPDPTFYPTLGNASRDISITYNIITYLRYYMGYSYWFIYDGEKKDQLLANEVIQSMPAYPEKGYAAMVDGVLVIKISK